MLTPMRPAFAGLILATSAALATPAEAPTQVDKLAWMAGCWTSVEKHVTTDEFWMPPAGGAMLGLSRTMKAGKMIESEFITIHEVDGKLVYVAKIEGQKDTAFTLTSLEENSVTFENPKHDFPQRVIYRKLASGIVARVEGTVKGKEQWVDYPYQACSIKTSAGNPS